MAPHTSSSLSTVERSKLLSIATTFSLAIALVLGFVAISKPSWLIESIPNDEIRPVASNGDSLVYYAGARANPWQLCFSFKLFSADRPNSIESCHGYQKQTKFMYFAEPGVKSVETFEACDFTDVSVAQTVGIPSSSEVIEFLREYCGPKSSWIPNLQIAGCIILIPVFIMFFVGLWWPKARTTVAVFSVAGLGVVSGGLQLSSVLLWVISLKDVSMDQGTNANMAVAAAVMTCAASIAIPFVWRRKAAPVEAAVPFV